MRGQRALAGFFILVLVASLVPASRIPVAEAQGASWLTGWPDRKEITISGSDIELTDYPVKIRVHYGDAPYLENFTRSVNNPIYDTPGSGWFISWWNGTHIWIFFQDDASPDVTIEAFSFIPDDWDNKTAWTDHGTIYTAVVAWENQHIEPHGIILETTAMAVARGGAGAERQLRLYYCAKGDVASTNYGVGFINASTTDLTTWTASASNPVIPKGGADGYADPKTVIYDDQVWIILAEYGAPDWCYFRRSTDGIVSWSAIRDSDYSVRHVMGSLVPLNGSGIGMINNLFGNEGITGVNDTFQFKVTQDGIYTEKYGGAILTAPDDGGWEDEFRWNSLVIDENGPALIDDFYYFYYVGHAPGGNSQLGVARLNYTANAPTDNGANVWVDELSEANFSDIRFTASDGATLIDQFNLTQMDGVFSDIYVEIPTVATGNTTIYMYYGNPGATSVFDADATLAFFDGFNRDDNATVGNGWMEDEGDGALSIDSGRLKLVQDGAEYSHVERAFPGVSNFRIEAKYLFNDSNSVSWAISSTPYWDPYKWVNVRPTQQASGFLFEKNDNADYSNVASNIIPDMKIGFWNFQTVTVDQSYVQGDYFKGHHTLNHDSTEIANISRTANWAGQPSLLIVGQGMDRTGASYPNADFDNSAGAPGEAGTYYVDWVFIRQFYNPEPTVSVWGERETVAVSNSAPALGAYTISNWDGEAIYTDEVAVNFWLQCSDADGGADVASHEFAILTGSVWNNFTFTVSTGLWVKDTPGSPIFMVSDGQGSWETTKNIMGFMFIVEGASETYNVVVYGRVTDASSATSGWGIVPGIGFNILSDPDTSGDSGSTGGYTPPGDDTDPGDTPGDPYWWTDPEILDDLSDEDLELLADSLGVDYLEGATRADLIAGILELAEEEGFEPFSGCGMDEEAKLAKLAYLQGLTIQELRLECQSLGISYKLWRDPEPYIVLIFTVGYQCSPPDAFYDQGYFDPEDWDEDGVLNWDDPDMFDPTRMGLGARVEEMDLSAGVPWVQTNGWALIILLLFVGFMYSQVKKRDKPGSRGESLIQPREGTYSPGGRSR